MNKIRGLIAACFLAILGGAVPVSSAQSPQYCLVVGGQVINIGAWDGQASVPGGTFVAYPTTGYQPRLYDLYNPTTGTFSAAPATAPAQGIVFASSPTAGATVTLPNAPQPQAKLYLYLTPSAALATLTVVLPPGPIDGDDLFIISTKAVTALTLSTGTGQALLNAPTSLAAGVSSHITWSQQLAAFFRL